MTTAPIASELTIPSDLAEVSHVEDLIEFALWSRGFGIHDVLTLKWAVQSALINAITHGNQNDPAKRVQIAFTVTGERFDVRIEDEGSGFNPDAPLTPLGIEPRGHTPCGLFIMRAYMTEVQFHGRGNVVTMSKVREVAQ